MNKDILITLGSISFVLAFFVGLTIQQGNSNERSLLLESEGNRINVFASSTQKTSIREGKYDVNYKVLENGKEVMKTIAIVVSKIDSTYQSNGIWTMINVSK